MQTGENSIIEARILYHTSYTYIVLLFAVKYNFMTLWLNTTINSFALSGLLHLIKHPMRGSSTPFKSLINFFAISQWGVGSRLALRV